MSDLQQPISTETALRLLVKQQRRRILRRMGDAPDGTTVDQLEKHLGGADAMNPDGSGTLDSRGIELHHAHLPMLQEANVIVYDGARGTVHRGERFQAVLSLLRVIDGHRDDASTMVA